MKDGKLEQSDLNMIYRSLVRVAKTLIDLDTEVTDKEDRRFLETMEYDLNEMMGELEVYPKGYRKELYL